MSKLTNPRNDRQVTLEGGFRMAGKPGKPGKVQIGAVHADWCMVRRLAVWLGALLTGVGVVQIGLFLNGAFSGLI